MQTLVSGLVGGLVSAAVVFGLGQISQKRDSNPTKPPEIKYEFFQMGFQSKDEKPDYVKMVGSWLGSRNREGWEPVMWWTSDIKIPVKLGRDIHREEFNVLFRRPVAVFVP